MAYEGEGTSGQVLTSNGSGETPTWQTPGGGGDVTLIASATASNDATVVFTNLDSTYHMIQIVLGNMVPVDDSVDLILRTSTNNGSSYDSGASDYSWMNMGYRSNSSGTDVSEVGSTVTEIQLCCDTQGSATNESGSWNIFLMNQSVAAYTYMVYNGSYENSLGQFITIAGSGVRHSAADVNAIQFKYTSGNIERGDIRVYGYAAS